MKSYDWQHITFADGSNPYICTTEKAFKYMRKHYNLVKLYESCGVIYWLAKCSDTLN